MSRSKIVALLGSLVLLLGVGGYAAAQAAGPSSGLCATNGTRVVRYFATCPAGSFPISLPSGTTVVSAPAAVSIVHKQITVDADYQGGTEAQRTVTIAGLPAFVSSGSAELWGSNNGGIPDGYSASVGVTRVTPTNGQTTRKFVLSPAGFNGAESYVLDVWVLVTT